MMHIFEDFEQRATKPESHFTPTWPRAGLYRAFDEWAVEVEVAEFLYVLARLVKPELVIESGAGDGHASTRALASAVSQNCYGRMIAFEPDPAHRRRALSAVRGHGRCEVLAGDSRDLSAEDHDDVDFVFLDSYPGERRHRELLFWLYRNVTLVIHDAHRYRKLLERQPGGQFFPCPRGLWLRVKRIDYGQDKQGSDGKAAEGHQAGARAVND